jgi:outer membrane lipoprotein carrier protein
MALLLSLSNSAHAENALQTYVNHLKTFSADFIQIRPDEALFERNKSVGHFELNRPGQLVWEYTKPMPQKIVVDGPNLWVYDKDLDQATVRPIADIKGDIPLSWLLYSEQIESKFSIIDVGQRSGKHWYNLTPKKATYFQSIEVGMLDGEMVEVWMYQGSDNIIKVSFKNIQSNVVIPLEAFQFQLPEGIDLIGQPQ